MIAYKFLAAGARGPLSGVAWPSDGSWLECGVPIVGKRGAHVCTIDQLAHWLHDELWEVETAGTHVAGLDCIAVERARLVRRIDAWTADAAVRFAKAALDRARAAGASDPRLADADEAVAYGYPAVAAYVAASAIAGGDDAAYAAERRHHSAWIAREIIGTDLL